MKIRIDRDRLAEAVTWTARTLPNKAPAPVLAGILLTATSDGVMADGELSLAAFDYEVSGRCVAACEVMDPGQVLLSGRMLTDIVKALPNKPVELASDGSRVQVTCGASRFTLLTMPETEYPTLPTMPPGSGVIPGDVFGQATAQVAVAASRDDTLPILGGVRVEVDGDTITLMATDRYRLAYRTINWKPAAIVSAAAIIRARTLESVAKTVGGADVTVALGDDMVGFEVGGRRTTSLLIDGEYPKVRSLFPAEHASWAVVNTAALIDAVKRVALVADRNTPVRLSFEDGQVTLEAGQGEDAQAAEAVECTMDGEPVVQAFNPQYLVDGLGALPQQYARFSFTTATKPAVITGQLEAEGDDDTTYRYLIMPVRTDR